MTSRGHRFRRALLALVALALAASRSASQTCNFSILTLPWPNQSISIQAQDIHSQVPISRPYWIAFGALAADPGADYDVAVYQHTSFVTACNPYPECFCNRLANSVAGGGRTDFIVGDFNHNPYDAPMVWTHCYGGTCIASPAGIYGWRDGNAVAVNAGLTTLDVNANTADGSDVLSVYDVYLTAGTTYYFNFHATGDRQTKMCLFANLPQGTYWAGRNAAAWETSQCMTAYTAPVTAYYGLVIVNDRLTSNPASISFGVTTTVSCNCPTVMTSDASQALPASPGDAYDVVIGTHPFWTAIGVRSAGDWDLTVGHTPSSAPSLGCPTDVITWSNLLAPKTDVLAVDFNYYQPGQAQDTASVRVNSFGGGQPAVVQWDDSDYSDVVWDNGPKWSGTLYTDDILRISDVQLIQNIPYTFSIKTCCADQKLLLFGNPTSTVQWYGRPNDFLETSSTATFTPTHTGFHGVAVVKEDANVGGFTIAVGHCKSATPLAARSPLYSNLIAYRSFQQTPGSWAAVGVSSAEADWDLQQYDQASGLAWPDCFGSPGALSAGSSGVDFVVGDFHANPPGTQYVRAYQYTPNLLTVGATEWDPGSGDLPVNGAPLTVTMDAQHRRNLWCWDVHLVGGEAYTFEFGRIGTADTHLFLFTNPTSGVYWAPRSAALFSATANQPFTAPQTGWYGVVVARDNSDDGRFTLRVSGSTVAVEAGTGPSRDALAGLSPNPARGAVRLAFDLANAAEPAFEVLDAQGRVLRHWSSGAFASGHWEVTMPAVDGPGRTLAPGLYFLRMRLGDRTVETRKLAIAP